MIAHLPFGRRGSLECSGFAVFVVSFPIAAIYHQKYLQMAFAIAIGDK